MRMKQALVVIVLFGTVNGDNFILSSKQQGALDEFRGRMNPFLYKNYMETDTYLLTWLRTSNWNVPKAESKLKPNLHWRRKNAIDNIQNENFEDMRHDFPAMLDSFDKQGRPIIVIELGNWDIRRAVLAGKGQRLLRYLDMLMDNATLQIFEQQKKGFVNVSQWSVLDNAQGFNMINQGCPICLSVWISFLDSANNHFDGWMHEFLIVDASPAVERVIQLLKAFLPKANRDKIKVLGNNRNQWIKYLDQRINRDQRPPVFGGTKRNNF